MASYLSNELAGTTTGTSTTAAVGYVPSATAGYKANLRRIRATVTLASQATTDTLILGILPKGACFSHGYINASVTLATSTLAVGISGNTGKYRAAATFTAANVPVVFAIATASTATALTADETVWGTIAVAALPSSGTLIVDLFYSMP